MFKNSILSLILVFFNFLQKVKHHSNKKLINYQYNILVINSILLVVYIIYSNVRIKIYITHVYKHI